MINIEIFTDGGTIRQINGDIISVSTCIVYVDNSLTIKVEKTLKNKSIDFAELFAIKKALSRVYAYLRINNINDNYKINVYSDSLTSIYSIINKGKKRTNFAKYQLIKETVALIDKLGSVSLYHIKSHIRNTDLKTTHKEFCIKNNVVISFSTFKFIRDQNEYCDKLVREEYYKCMMN